MQSVTTSPRAALEAKYNASRNNLLFIILASIVNIVLLLTNTNTYFLFSANIPYAITDYAMLITGKYPPEFYVEAGITDDLFLSNTVFAVLLAIAAIIISLYFFAWLFSKKGKVGWLIFALVLLSLDTLFMIVWWGVALDMIIDILFHGLMIYYMVNGIVVNSKLKKLPPEAAENYAAEDEYTVGHPPVEQETENKDDGKTE